MFFLLKNSGALKNAFSASWEFFFLIFVYKFSRMVFVFISARPVWCQYGQTLCVPTVVFSFFPYFDDWLLTIFCRSWPVMEEHGWL